MPSPGSRRGRGRAPHETGPVRRQHWFDDLRGVTAAESAAARLSASESRESLDAHAPPVAGGANWTPIGPTGAVRGQTRTRATISGRVRAIEVGPNGTRAYVAAPDGGVWRYDRTTIGADVHDVWTPVDDFVMSPNLVNLAAGNALACNALLVTFGATTNLDTLFVGTGEPAELTPPQFGSGPSYNGVGIRVSIGGAGARTWHAEAPLALRGQAVSRLFRDPDNAAIVWAATTAGLYVRPAGAGPNTEWNLIPRGAGTLLPGNRQISDVVITGSTAAGNKTIFAAARGGAAAAPTRSSGVYTSTDNGVTWNLVPITPASAADPGRIALAVSGPNQVVYRFDEQGRLWRYDGAQFVRVQQVPPRESTVDDQGFYDLALAIEPGTDDTVWIGGAVINNDNPGSLNPQEWDAALYRGTVTLVAGNRRFGYTSGANPDASPTWRGHGIHGDCHAVAFARDAAGNLVAGETWIGCDGGVFRSPTGANATFLPVNDTLGITQPTFFDNHPTSDGIVVTGSQDNGVIRGEGAAQWRVLVTSDGGGVAFDPHNPLRILAQNLTSSLVSVADGGLSGMTTAAGPTLSTGENATMYARLVASPAVEPDTTVLYSTTRIWVSYDFGANWRVLPNNVAVGAGGRAIGRLNGDNDPITDVVWQVQNRFHACTRQFVFRYDRTARNANHTTDVWTRPATRLPATALPAVRTITSLGVVNPATDDLYCGLGGANTGNDHVFWYDQTGAGTWVATGFGPGMTVAGVATPFDAPVNALVVDPGNPRHLYVGTDVGVFRGERSAAGPPFTWTWLLWSNGLPEATVLDLKVHAPTRRLRAALHGRGIWEFDLAAAVTPDPDVFVRMNGTDSGRHLPAARNAAHPFQAAPRTVTWTMSPDIKVRRTGTAAQPAPAYPGTTLRVRTPRDTGANVTRWQAHVQRRGFTIGADAPGTFDAGSRQAARDLQSRYGLVDWDGARFAIDGIVGPRTWAATTTYPALPVPMTPTAFAELIGEDTDLATDVMIADHGPNQVFLQVQNRGHIAVPAGGLITTLLVAGSTAAGVVPQLPVGYAGRVTTQDTTAWLAGSGWQFADATRYRSNVLALDQRQPAILTWSVDFATLGFAAGTFVMLLALTSGPAPSTLTSAERTVQTLVEGAGAGAGNPRVAARLVRLDAVAAIP